MRRDLVEVRLGDLDVIAEDGVETHLQRRDSGALDFLLLQPCDPILAFARAASKFVEIGVEPLPDDSPFLHRQRRFINDRPADQLDQIRQWAELGIQFAQERGPASRSAGPLEYLV